MSEFIKGNQFQLFYHNGTAWKALAYATSHSASFGGYETEEVACKEFGLTPKKELTKGAEPPEISGEYLYSKAAFDVFMGMHNGNTEYSFCVAEVGTWSESTGYTIGTVTPKTSGGTVMYFNGYVSSVDLSSDVNSNATMSITIQAKTKTSTTVPTASTDPKLISYSAS